MNAKHCFNYENNLRINQSLIKSKLIKINNKNSIRFFIATFVVLLFTLNTFAINPNDLTLPLFTIELDQEEYEEIEENYREEISAEATLIFNGVSYDGIVSLRGATSRNQPKKSWKFEFDESGPGGIEVLNLDAAYRDATVCRNLLSMHLAQFLMMDAPNTSHASLIINEDYKGVFIAVEQVNDLFFENRNLNDSGFRIKSYSHSGKFSPFMTRESFDEAYDIKQATQAELDTFQLRTQIIQWAEPDQLAAHLGRIFDIDNLINFFAMNFAIMNMDGLTKNFYAYEKFDGKYGIIPWDADASFGIDWRGDFYPEYTDSNTFFTLYINPLYGRLMEDQFYIDQVENKLRNIADGGFAYIAGVLQTQTELIENDLSFDPNYDRTMEEFYAARDSLYQFLNRRGVHLNNLDITGKTRISEFDASPEYIESTETEVLFTATVDNPDAIVQLHLADGQGYLTYMMNDGGYRGDVEADDGVFSRLQNFEQLDLPVYYCFTVSVNDFGAFPTPPAGLFYHEYSMPQNPSIQALDTKPESDSLLLGPFFYDQSSGSKLMAIVNSSGSDLSLNGCYLAGEEFTRLFMFQDVPVLSSGDTLFVSNNPEYESGRFPHRTFSEVYPGFPESQDTLSLYTAGGSLLAEKRINFYQQNEYSGDVSINEICFTENNLREPGDWFELYFREENIDLTGWTIRDRRLDHIWQFPANAADLAYDHGGYLVLAQSISEFRNVFPDIENVLGSFEFSLGNEEDHIYIYDSENRLIDQVFYTNHPPWPDVRNNPGRSIELRDTLSNNFNASNWSLCLNSSPAGTPGKMNSILDDPEPPPPPPFVEEWELVGITPNPFESHLYFNLRADEASKFRLSVFNVLGQQVCCVEKDIPGNGEYRIYWPVPNNWASGMYFFRVEEPVKGQVIPLVRLK